MLRDKKTGLYRFISGEAVDLLNAGDKANQGTSRSVARGLLYSSVLTGGILMANGMGVVPAYAGPCSTASNTNPNVTTCTGGATNTGPGLTYVTDSDPAYLGGDFTLELDGHDVNSVNAGENGITFSGVSAGDDGTIILHSDSDVVSGSGADGINSSATNAGTTTTIRIEDTSSVTGANNGIVATATGGGAITINTQVDSTVTGNAGDGIRATGSGAGNVVVDALGGVTGTGAGNDGIEATAVDGTVQVTTGTKAVGGVANGINASSTNNSVEVITGTGAVTASAGNGITASGATGTTVTSNGVVTGTGGAGIIAISTGTGTVAVTTNGTGLVSGTDGDGIHAEALADGNIDIEANTDVTGSANGIYADSFEGAVEVTTGAVGADVDILGQGGHGIDANSGGSFAPGVAAVTVSTNGNVTGASGNGINALALADGDVNVTTAGAAGSLVRGQSGDGIFARVQGTGNVDIDAQTDVTGSENGIKADAADGTVEVTTGAVAVLGEGGHGIEALSGGFAPGTTVVTVETGGNVTGVGGAGISAIANGDGDVSVTTGGAADTLVQGQNDDGIKAEAKGEGNVDVDAQTDVTGSATGIDADAVNGTVTVKTGAYDIIGQDDNGIDATSAGTTLPVGTAAVSVTTGGNVTGQANNGINAVATGDGDVEVTTAGAAGTLIDGQDGDGINADAQGTGNVDVEANTNVKGSVIGIDANAEDGNAEVTSAIGVTVTGGNGNGVDATASGDVDVSMGGTVTGTGGTGINAVSSDEGDVEVTTAGSSYVTSGTAGDGIHAETTGAGEITITNNSTTFGSDSGIEAISVAGAIQITNEEVIRNAINSPTELAIRTAGGPTTIDNNDTIIGRVLTGNADDTLNNNYDWYVGGFNDFGGGTGDAVNNNNEGYIYAGNSTGSGTMTTFANLEDLNNESGATIYLTDQMTGDGSNYSDVLLVRDGNYNGNGGTLEIDAFLGGPTSLADVLDVGQDITGVTEIYVNDTNAGPGGYNPNGILVAHADGNTTADNFVLANGPIDKGLFFYDLLFDAANGDHLLVGLPDREVFETLAAVSSSQEIWRESADAWSTRQENLRDVLATRQVVTGVADPAVVEDDRPMGSLWVSALGSWAERDNDASFSILNGSFEFDTSYQQDIYGVVGGADFRADMGGDTSMLFGVMGGYVDSKLNFDESSTSIDTNGGTVGAYAALMSGGFFATVLVKADLLNMDYTVGSLAEDDNDDANVTTWGVRGDLGYRFGDSLFVEPMLSLDGISTKIDEFTIGGVDIDAGTNESFRGGAGVRAGYSDDTFRASATARVWDVFSTDNEVDVLADVPLGITDDGMEGVYGDVSGQIDVNLSTSATVYLKGGILFSDDVTKPNASGGFAFYW